MDGGVAALAAELRSICGDEHTLTHHDQLRTYESDGLLQYAALPGVVALPATGEEVRRCVEACHRAGAPFVARGAGSGLSGGAMPVEGGALIGCRACAGSWRWTSRTSAWSCEPGVTNIAISEAVGPSHFYPPDPSSQIVCSIGGNVAENSGGAHCFKYGFTTNYVTGLEVVLPDGQMIQLGGKGLDMPGLDLVGAFVGSRGHAGSGHQDHGEGGALARDDAHAGGLLRFHLRGRRGGFRRGVRGHRGRSHGDDGQPLDPRRRGRHRRGLPAGRRRGAGGGARRVGDASARRASTRWCRCARRAAPGRCAWHRTRPSAR